MSLSYCGGTSQRCGLSPSCGEQRRWPLRVINWWWSSVQLSRQHLQRSGATARCSKVSDSDLPNLYLALCLGWPPLEFRQDLWHWKSRIWCCFLDPVFTILVKHGLVTDRQRDKPAGWFLRPDWSWCSPCMRSSSSSSSERSGEKVWTASICVATMLLVIFLLLLHIVAILYALYFIHVYTTQIIVIVTIMFIAAFRISDTWWRVCQFDSGWFVTSSSAFTNGMCWTSKDSCKNSNS